MIARIIVIIPAVILGILFYCGKGAFLVAGYNTMSDTEKKQYDEKAILKFMSKLMFCVTIALVLFALSDFYNISWLENTASILIALIIIFAIVYSNTGNRFKIKK